VVTAGEWAFRKRGSCRKTHCGSGMSDLTGPIAHVGGDGRSIESCMNGGCGLLNRLTGSRGDEGSSLEHWGESLGTNSYLLIRYMSSKLQANGKKTSPVITLQMLGFFRIY